MKRGRKKLTGWFNREIDPLYWGFYEVDCFDRIERMFWTGERWLWQRETSAFVPFYGELPWRGILRGGKEDD